MVALNGNRESAIAPLRESPDDFDGGQGQVDLTSPQQAPPQQQANAAAEKSQRQQRALLAASEKVSPRRSNGSKSGRIGYRDANSIGGRSLSGQKVQMPGHVRSIKQRYDNVLLMPLYEESSEISLARAGCCGDLGGKPSVLERYHPAVVACLEFMRALADAYASACLLKIELITERNSCVARIKKMQNTDGEDEKLKRQRISGKQPAGAKKLGCQPVDADQPQPNTSGGGSQETNADGTPQPIKKPARKAKAKSAARKPTTTLAMKATKKEQQKQKSAAASARAAVEEA